MTLKVLIRRWNRIGAGLLQQMVETAEDKKSFTADNQHWREGYFLFLLKTKGVFESQLLNDNFLQVPEEKAIFIPF